MARKKKYTTTRRLDWNGGFIEPGEELPANYPPDGVASLLERGYLEEIKVKRSRTKAADQES